MTAKRRPKKEPTLAEVMALVQALDAKVTPLVTDVADLKQYRRDQEITKAAIAEYVQSNPPLNTKKPSDAEQSLNLQLAKNLGTALAIILGALYLYAQFKGTPLK